MKKSFYAVLFSLLATTIVTLSVAPIQLNNNNNQTPQNNQVTEQNADEGNESHIQSRALEEVDIG